MAAPKGSRHGQYDRVVPVRLPDSVVDVYEEKAEADGMTLGLWIKKLLIELSGVESVGLSA